MAQAAKKLPFKADRVGIERVMGGWLVRATKNASPGKNDWQEETAIATSWEEAQTIVNEFLNAGDK